MNARHIEERREIFMGEEQVYFVTVFEPLPEPSQENPYDDDGRCFERSRSDVRAAEPVVEGRAPSKADYVRSFARAGALPECVGRTVAGNRAFVRAARERFGVDRDAMPRRLRKAIARLDLADLATHYDTGAIGRVSHYLHEHQGRAARAIVLS